MRLRVAVVLRVGGIDDRHNCNTQVAAVRYQFAKSHAVRASPVLLWIDNGVVVATVGHIVDIAPETNHSGDNRSPPDDIFRAKNCMTKPSDPDQTLLKMPSLRAVKSFVAAAKYQSFTRAAEALCVTQAAISRQIRELEDYLGTELFIRSGRKVLLSDAGSRFYDAAQLSFINIAQAAERIRIKHPTRQLLTVCCSPAFANLWLQPRMPAFLKAHPDIELTVLATQDFWSLEAGVQPDIFITKMSKVREGYVSTRLFHDVVYPVCSPAYLEDVALLEEPADLCRVQLLDLSPYGRSQLAEHVDWHVWLSLQGVDFAPNKSGLHFPYSSNDYSTLVQLAVAGQGVALGWNHLVAPLLTQGTLVRPIAHEVVHQDRCHYLSVREDHANTEAIVRFDEWVRSVL